MKWFSLPIVMSVLAISAPVNADLLSRLENAYHQGEPIHQPEVVMEPQTVLPNQLQTPPSSGFSQLGGVAGYPFRSSCCAPASACCSDLWRGYCGQRTCGQRTLSWFEHCAGSCGPCHKGGWGWRGAKGHGGKISTCGSSCQTCGPVSTGHACTTKGGTCHAKSGPGCGSGDPCHRPRLGLFDWLHRRNDCRRCGKGTLGCGKGTASCGCNSQQTLPGGVHQSHKRGETTVVPHSVPEPTLVPTPSIAPHNSARRLAPYHYGRANYGS